jgi:hypothetical protein
VITKETLTIPAWLQKTSAAIDYHRHGLTSPADADAETTLQIMAKFDALCLEDPSSGSTSRTIS